MRLSSQLVEPDVSRPRPRQPLVEAVGVGLDIAAEMLVTAGGNSNRIRCEAAFAKMCGTCPTPRIWEDHGRYRFNRGGASTRWPSQQSGSTRTNASSSTGSSAPSTSSAREPVVGALVQRTAAALLDQLRPALEFEQDYYRRHINPRRSPGRQTRVSGLAGTAQGAVAPGIDLGAGSSTRSRWWTRLSLCIF